MIGSIKLLETVTQGNKLAEADLKLRGPGNIFGFCQHGFPKLKIASFSDLNLIKSTKTTATNLVGSHLISQALQESLKKVTIQADILN